MSPLFIFLSNPNPTKNNNFHYNPHYKTKTLSTINNWTSILIDILNIIYNLIKMCVIYVYYLYISFLFSNILYYYYSYSYFFI